MKGNFYKFSISVAIILFVIVACPLEAAPVHSAQALLSGCGSSYTVRAGDTLSAIAARCGISLSALMSANGLRTTSVIYPGQRLVISGGAAAPSGTTGGATTYTSCTNPYIVRSGDTLSRIAARCGIAVATLKQLNGLSSDNIWVGQRLYVRGAVPRPTASPNYRSGIVPAPVSPPLQGGNLPRLPTPTPRIETPISLW